MVWGAEWNGGTTLHILNLDTHRIASGCVSGQIRNTVVWKQRGWFYYHNYVIKQQAELPLRHLHSLSLSTNSPLDLNQKIYYYLLEGLPVECISSQFYLIHSSTPYNFKVNFNIFQPFLPLSAKWSLPYTFSGICMHACMSHLPHACYIFRHLSHLVWSP